MEAIYIAVCTNGKIFAVSDPDQAKAAANVSHVYEVSPLGRTPALLCTLSGSGSPYTITSAGVPTTAGHVKILS